MGNDKSELTYCIECKKCYCEGQFDRCNECDCWICYICAINLREIHKLNVPGCFCKKCIQLYCYNSKCALCDNSYVIKYCKGCDKIVCGYCYRLVKSNEKSSVFYHYCIHCSDFCYYCHFAFHLGEKINTPAECPCNPSGHILLSKFQEK